MEAGPKISIATRLGAVSIAQSVKALGSHDPSLSSTDNNGQRYQASTTTMSQKPRPESIANFNPEAKVASPPIDYSKTRAITDKPWLLACITITIAFLGFRMLPLDPDPSRTTPGPAPEKTQT